MTDTLIGAVIALAGVLIANIATLRSAHALDTRTARRARQDKKEEVFAAAIAAIHTLRMRALFAGATGVPTASVVSEQRDAAFTSFADCRAAMFRAWLLAGDDVRKQLDAVDLPTLQAASAEMFGQRTDELRHPSLEPLRSAMRREIATI
ncbi:hypothetical protein ASG36_02210 [Geodermatophilus sp. Leaf369]|uniref:hypothetical protein n=1 Tax=Geodermatophilus sp. Leaf369 TaxID=1736354 RepID=UPI0006FE7547|nr:hypothetical protein [Geodermatophilus sp. Leaf369]KQS59875.1 hypothetical protein ASG36_02210 [Geodermatophilus sp. Leaf369]